VIVTALRDDALRAAPGYTAIQRPEAVVRYFVVQTPVAFV
jgi:hypothetical protein